MKFGTNAFYEAQVILRRRKIMLRNVVLVLAGIMLVWCILHFVLKWV